MRYGPKLVQADDQASTTAVASRREVGVLGAALAMLGPGCCPVDARLFGRKHIDIPQR